MNLATAKLELKKLIAGIDTVMHNEAYDDKKKHSVISFLLKDRFGRGTEMSEIVAAADIKNPQSTNVLLRLAARKDAEVKQDVEFKQKFAETGLGLVSFMDQFKPSPAVVAGTQTDAELEAGETTV